MTMIAKRRAEYQWRSDFDSDASSISYDYDDGQTASRVPAEKANEAKQERKLRLLKSNLISHKYKIIGTCCQPIPQPNATTTPIGFRLVYPVGNSGVII